MVSPLSFLLLLSLSSLAYKVSLSFLACVFLNICVVVERKGKGKGSPVLLCLKHCCGCRGSRCLKTCQ